MIDEFLSTKIESGCGLILPTGLFSLKPSLAKALSNAEPGPWTFGPFFLWSYVLVLKLDETQVNPPSFSSLQAVTSLLQRKQHFHPFDIHGYQLTADRHRVSSTGIMAESVQTRPGDPPRFDYAVPVVTALAALDNRDVIYGRQMYGNCGYYEHDDYTGKVLSFFPLLILTLFS